MNGPNPVCTSARKKMNQSRPRKLWREGVAVALRVAGSDARDGILSRPIDRPGRSTPIRPIEWDERANSIFLRTYLGTKLQWQQAAGGAEHHDRCTLLVFRRRHHLIFGQFESDAVTLGGDASEMQRVPIDHDFSAADPEKTAEIDDSRAYHSGAIDDHVDDAPHVLVRRAANVAAEHAMCIPCADDGDRGRWRRLFRCCRGIWCCRGSRILLLGQLR